MALSGVVGQAWAGWQVVALKFGERVGKGIRTSPRDALIGDSVDAANRGLAFSFHRAMDHAGAVAGPLVAMALLYLVLGYGRWGVGEHNTGGAVPAEEMTALRWLFAVALIPGLAAMAALVFKVREIAPVRSAPPGGAAKASVWKRLPGRFYAFVAIVTLFSLGNSSDLFLLLYAQELFHFDLQSIILLWVVLHVSKIVFSLPGGILSDRLGRRPAILAGWVFYAAVYMGMAFIDPSQPWQFWALFLAYGVYYGMSEGAEKALVTDFVPSEFRGTAFGIYHGAIGLAALPASLLFGIWWAVIGPKVAFGIGAALAGLAAVLLLVLLASTRRDHV
jgi:MFS family permease